MPNSHIPQRTSVAELREKLLSVGYQKHIVEEGLQEYEAILDVRVAPDPGPPQETKPWAVGILRTPAAPGLSGFNSLTASKDPAQWTRETRQDLFVGQFVVDGENATAA